MAHHVKKHPRRYPKYTTDAMIRSIEAMRGIFVTLIFLVHYPLDGPPTFAAGGDCGVAFFMMLSGFVMSAGYGKRLMASKGSDLSFTWRRIAKIYPLHLLCFGLALCLYDYVLDMATITDGVINLALLQSWVPEATFTFNTVSWFLSDLAFFYLVFPLIVRHRLTDRRRVITAFFVFVALYLCLIPMIPEDNATQICYIFPPARLIDFFGGMLLWRLFTTLRDGRTGQRFARLGFAWRSLLETGAVALVAVTVILYAYFPTCYKAAAMWWPSMAVVILVFSLSDNHPGAIGMVLRSRVLQVFGGASFAFFIFHRVGMSIVFRVLDRLDVTLDGTPLLLVNFAGVTIGALIIHKYFQSLWNQKLRSV